MQKLAKFPKTTVAAIVGALVTYSLGKGWIGADEANFFSAILVALGLTVNSPKLKK